MPLFLMELCELRLLSSDFFFVTDFFGVAIICLCGSLFLVAVLFALMWEKHSSQDQRRSLTKRDQDLEASETTVLLQPPAGEAYSGVKSTQIASKQEKWAVCQYMADLKLPFEILAVTCMLVKLRQCCPIILQLLPRVIDS